MQVQERAPEGTHADRRPHEGGKKDKKKQEPKPARLRMRALAVMIDGAVMLGTLFFMLVVGLAIGNFEDTPAPVRLAISITYVVLLFGSGPAYLIWGLVRFEGTTPGKRMLGMKVVRLDGTRVSFKRAFVREFVLKLWLFGFTGQALLFVSGIVGLFSDERRTLHDRITDTRVVMRSKPSRRD